MIEMLSYGFMQKAFIAGLFIALSMACIGMVSVLRRHSMIGDHYPMPLWRASLWFVLSISPVTMAIVVAMSAFSIEVFHRTPGFGVVHCHCHVGRSVWLVCCPVVTAANFIAICSEVLFLFPTMNLACSHLFLVVVILSALFYKEYLYWS